MKKTIILNILALAAISAHAQQYTWTDLDLSGVTQADWDIIGGGNGGSVTINDVNGRTGLDLTISQIASRTGTWTKQTDTVIQSTIGNGGSTRLSLAFSGANFADAFRVTTDGIATNNIENVRFFGTGPMTWNQISGTNTPVVTAGAIDGTSNSATFGFTGQGNTDVQASWDAGTGSFIFHDLTVDNTSRINRYSFELGETVIPEPSSVALLGLAGLGALTRRKR